MKPDLPERAGLLLLMLRLMGVALVFGVIWAPWCAYNHLPEPRIAEDTIDEARHVPDNALLAELGSYDLYPSLPWANDQHLVKAAEMLLQGRVELPGFQPATVTLPLSSAAMASGPTMWQLFVQSLGLPRVLLDAYKLDGRPEFLNAATEYLLAYDAYEGSGWAPGGYLWKDSWRSFVRNDHAVSARVPVLTEFWRLYRHSPNYRPEVGNAVFRMIGRASWLLADPSRFTVATNHGVMQNLAVCNINLAFPTLPGTEDYCRLARERLNQQFAFLVNDEGFVLEHSPGYQEFDLRLIAIAFRYMTLSKLEIPEPWLRKYQAAQQVYAQLRRPDGSLPLFGDTDGGEGDAGPVIAVVDNQGQAGKLTRRSWSPNDAVLLAPVAGYCLWWNGLGDWPVSNRLSQTAISWSYFQGMGHKHADEMSLAFWARGTSWWANVGYWPYDAAGRNMAESWDGSNAPHLVDESADSVRETRLRYQGHNGRLAMVDLERVGPGSYKARRQIVQVGPRIWLVIDASSGGKNGRTRATWTTSPAVRLKDSGALGAYKLTDTSSGQSLQAYFSGAQATTQQVIKGSYSPFGGWSVVSGKVQPAASVVVERPTDGLWSLASWSLAGKAETEAGFSLTDAPRIQRWAGAEDWEAMLSTTAGLVTLRRSHGQIAMSMRSGRALSLMLKPGPDVARQTADFRVSLTSASGNYGAADMSGTYRLKVTVVLLIALLLSAIALRVARRFRPAWNAPLGVVLTAGWLLLSFYFVFLRANLF